MKKIKLTKGKYALVDNADYEELNHYKWHTDSRGYARRSQYFGRVDGESVIKSFWMHRQIIGDILEKEIDHINGNRLDNQRHNLRHCTHQENSFNIHKSNRGVSWHKLSSKWRAYLVIDSRQIHLGLFTNKRAAARAFDQAAIKYFGDYHGERTDSRGRTQGTAGGSR